MAMKTTNRIIGTRGSAGPVVPGEAITHAINRMRSQGYSDDQIAGQVRTWHPDWNDPTVASRIVKNVQTGRATNEQALRAAKTVQGAQSYTPQQQRTYSGPTVEKAKPYYHKTSSEPFFEGQQPDHFIAAGRAGAIPVYVYGHGKSGPTGDESTQWNADQVAYAAHEKFVNEGGIPGAVFRGALHPATDLGAMIRGDKPASVGGVVSDVGNIASNFVPVGKAAGIIGGLRGLSKLGRTAQEAHAVEDAAKTAQAAGETAQVFTPAEQLRTGLKGARSQYGKQAVARSEERSRRAQAVEHALRTISDPNEAQAAAKAAMRGELPKIDFQGLKELNPDALRALKTHVNQHDTLLPFQKLRLNTALDKAFEGTVPTPGEMRLVEHVFGKTTAVGIAQKAGQGKWDTLINVANIPRSVMATADLSAAFRQGLVAGASHPAIWGKAWPTMVKSMRSGKFYDEAMQSIKEDPLYDLALAGKVSFTDVGEQSALAAHEEAFASDYAAKIPGFGHVIKGSARAYTGFLNKLRMDLFKHQIRIAQAAGRDVNDEKFLTDVGKVVNAATGRGSMPASAEHIMPALNTFLFSPRLMLSRINYLDPTWYVRLSPQARKEALRGLFATAGAVTGTVTLAAQIPGVHVGSLDPRSPDFGKAKIGDTRVDLAGGFQQYVRLAAELATNTKVSSTSGNKEHLGHGFGIPTRADEIQNFLYNKFAPVPAMVHNIIKGKDSVGQSVTTESLARQNFIPLVAQDALDIYHDSKGGMDGITAAIGGLGVGAVGFGVQTYPGIAGQAPTPSEKKDLAVVDQLAPEKFRKTYEEDVRIAHAMNAATSAAARGAREGAPREQAKLLATLNVLHEFGRMSDDEYDTAKTFYTEGDGANLTPYQARNTRRHYENDYKAVLRAVQRVERQQKKKN